MTKRRPLALGAAVTIGFGSLFLATPAMAAPGPVDASGSHQKLQSSTLVPDEAPVAEAAALEAAGVEVVALGVDSSGDPVIVETADSAETREADRAREAYGEQQGGDVTIVTISERPQAYAATDVVGGAPYLIDDRYLCSIGFSAWSAEGDPVLLSAGHCTNDGTATQLELVLPSQQEAVIPDGYAGESNGTGILGVFGFSQFGGPGNAPGYIDGDGNPVDADDATDISVIEDINPDLTLHPEVTDWTTAEDEDLAASALPIKTATLADPEEGSEIQKSGRTTGLTSGSVGVLVDGWSAIEDRWVRGFQSNILAGPGDSGGSVFQGTNALGVISGGSPADEENEQFTWTASLKRALPHTGGVEIALDIDEPVVTSGTTVAPGATITGTAPSNATEVSVSTGNAGELVPVSGGAWSTTAPSEEGDYTFSLAAVNGFSSSETIEFSFTVEADDEAPIVAAPTVDSIDTTSATAELSVDITGTGVAGATINLNGDVSGTGTVDADGNWSIPALLGIGTYSISVSQTVDGETSAATEGTLVVSPIAPETTSITPGATFPEGEGPSSISGTGIDGASVTLQITGNNEPYVTDVANGEWTVDFGAVLGAGEYTATFSQSLNGVQSSETSVAFVVEGSDTPAPTPEDPEDPSEPTDPDAPADPEKPADPENPGDGDTLPNTGDTLMLPLGISAVVALIAGAATLVLVRRRHLQVSGE